MKIKNLVQTCGACPSQWEASTEDNRPIYIRYRWGYLEIHIGKPGDDVHEVAATEEVYGAQLGDSYHGVISWQEIEPIVEALQA